MGKKTKKRSGTHYAVFSTHNFLCFLVRNMEEKSIIPFRSISLLNKITVSKFKMFIYTFCYVRIYLFFNIVLNMYDKLMKPRLELNLLL